MTNKNTPDNLSHNDALADEVAEWKAAKITARMEDTLVLERALRLVEQSLALKYVAALRFASFSPAHQHRIMAQTKKLDAAILTLAHVFDDAYAEAKEAKAASNRTPMTLEESLALTRKAHKAAAED